MATVEKKKKTTNKVVKEAEKLVNKKKTTKSTPKVKNEVKNKKEKGIKNYINSVRRELAKVKFPTQKQMIEYTVATLVFILFFALFFFIIQALFAGLDVWIRG